ncbi:MAG TPA: GAF and ANTAR domain-containing protein [Acidimicrobiales bacterium]|nr:GAF and ANTAR domain-containing protein [Acidimicrobiales bacterium]
MAKSLQAISRFCIGDATLQETLERVAELSLEAVPSADLAGITMLLEGRPRTAVFTDEAAHEIDSAQYETGTGPCLDAFRHKQVFRIDDVSQDHHWPSFSEAAAAYGVGSVMSIPLLARHEGVGALNFYSRTVEAFSDDDVQVGIAFATQAALLLASSQAYWDAEQLQSDMATAMESWATIERAKGILMGVHPCSEHEALQILVRTAQREKRKLPEIAEELVAKSRRWDPTESPYSS